MLGGLLLPAAKVRQILDLILLIVNIVVEQDVFANRQVIRLVRIDQACIVARHAVLLYGSVEAHLGLDEASLVLGLVGVRLVVQFGHS